VYTILNGLEGIESGSIFIKRVGIYRGAFSKAVQKEGEVGCGEILFQQQKSL